MRDSSMLAWPKIFIPKVDVDIPHLTLRSQTGDIVFDGKSPTRLYVCGITPYDSTHLGHAATYLTYDVILRYLTARGSTVSFVENITDVDEPLLERAERDGIDWQDLASSQVDLFTSDMTALHIQSPDHFVPVTTVMPLVDSAITKMKENGYVYSVENDLYFDITSFLPNLPIPLDDALSIFAERGGDPARAGKRHPLDPVLWLSQRDGEPGWQSSHGVGRPGWHVECAVIALRFLNGENFLNPSGSLDQASIEIQGGGSDLVFPHHFMSASQAQAITGQKFARATVHSAMIGLDGEKMSKSKGNLVFVSTLISEGVDPMAIRWALLSDHYQTDRMWYPEKMAGYTQQVERVRSALSRELVSPTDGLIQTIAESLSRNLDTPAALSALLAWSDETIAGESATQAGAGELSRFLDALLGLAL